MAICWIGCGGDDGTGTTAPLDQGATQDTSTGTMVDMGTQEEDAAPADAMPEGDLSVEAMVRADDDGDGVPNDDDNCPDVANESQLMVMTVLATVRPMRSRPRLRRYRRGWCTQRLRCLPRHA